jgi:FkbM family methyltransferase
MKLKYLAGLALAWPLDRLLRARWFPLLRTFHIRQHWLYDICRFAGRRDLGMIFDVGANVGQTALHLRTFFPRAAIHSFEPVGQTFLQLQHRVRRWPNLQPHQLALGSAPESREILLQDCSELNSLSFTPGPGATGSSKVERVEVTTLDLFCATHGIGGIDILKTDAQGRDVDVLCGGDRLISSGNVPFIYTEVGFQPDDPINTPFAAIDRHLAPRGYRLSGLYEQSGWGPRGSLLSFCNALYLHPEALQRRFPRDAAAG